MSPDQLHHLADLLRRIGQALHGDIGAPPPWRPRPARWRPNEPTWRPISPTVFGPASSAAARATICTLDVASSVVAAMPVTSAARLGGEARHILGLVPQLAVGAPHTAPAMPPILVSKIIGEAGEFVDLFPPIVAVAVSLRCVAAALRKAPCRPPSSTLREHLPRLGCCRLFAARLAHEGVGDVEHVALRLCWTRPMRPGSGGWSTRSSRSPLAEAAACTAATRARMAGQCGEDSRGRRPSAASIYAEGRQARRRPPPLAR